jgi:hypothetical protein
VHFPVLPLPALKALLTRQVAPGALQLLLDVVLMTQFPLETKRAFCMKPEKPISGTHEATPRLLTAKTPTPQRIAVNPSARKMLTLFILSSSCLFSDANRQMCA